jgi:hypothetical protein
MIRCLAACVIVAAAGLMPASQALADARSDAVAQCRAEGFGARGSSPDATRAQMRQCVMRKLGGKKKKQK